MKTAMISVDTEEGPKKIAYTQWGNGNDDTPIFCVHGLTRNSRDFDFLASYLTEIEPYQRTVICIDVVGRGDSDQFTDKTLYGYPAYNQLCLNFLAALNIKQVDWVGTSMGGLIGMMIAAEESGKPVEDRVIRRLVLNDVGSFIPKESLERIGEYAGSDPEFALLENAEQYLRLIMQSFGKLTDEQWQHLAAHSFYKAANGKYRFKYDPAIAQPFKVKMEDADLSAVWNLVDVPVLLIRGKESDLLLKETAVEMAEKDNCQLVEFSDVGHAPMLMDTAQIRSVSQFLQRKDR